MLPLGTDDPRMIGEFRLHARLGAGGMGRVFLASSPGGLQVAVKVVHPQLARDAIFLGRFRREVAAARAVNGGYTAPVIAAGPDDDPPWLATAYIPGPSLREAVTAAGPLPEDVARKLAAGLAKALRAIHACGLVHRDLKPANVLLAADGPRVIDFGIARALDGTVLTATESVLETPSFISPEQAQGLPTDPASDVFSLGGVVYFAATGDGPFGTGAPAVTLYRIMHTEPDLERLPPGLRELAGACLAKEPARRPALTELAAALQDRTPPGASAAAFWPAPVAQLIADHQSRPTAGPRPPAEAPPPEPPPAELSAAKPPPAEPTPAVLPPAELPTAEPPPAELPSAEAPDATRSAEGPTAEPPPAELPTAEAPDATRAAEAPTRPTHAEPPTEAPTEPTPAEPLPRPLTKPPSAEAVPAAPRTGAPTDPTPAGSLSAPPTAVPLPPEPPTAVPLPPEPPTAVPLPPEPTLAEQLPAAFLAEPLPAEQPPPERPARGVGRRRVLTVLGGVAVGGLAVAGWELTRPGPAASATRHLAVGHAAKPRAPGAKIWSYPVGGAVEAVAVAGHVVFAGTGQNNVYALDAATGALIWGSQTTHAHNDQVVLAGNNVIIGNGSDGGIYALDADTGRQRWSVSSGRVRGLAAADGIVYAGVAVKRGTTGGVLALSADRGKRVWTAEFVRKLDSNGKLAVSHGVVYVTTTHGEIYAFRASNGRKLWRIAGRNVRFGTAPPVVADGVVYASSGNKVPVLYAVHAATGRGLWHRSLGASSFPAYLAVADGVVFAGLTRINGAAGLNAGDLSARDAATGQQLWKVPVAGGVDLAPAAATGIVYTGSNNGALDAWQAGTGAKVWSFSTAGLIGTNIAVARGVVYFGSNDNHVYAVIAQP